jgi:hypothetical protein
VQLAGGVPDARSNVTSRQTGEQPCQEPRTGRARSASGRLFPRRAHGFNPERTRRPWQGRGPPSGGRRPGGCWRRACWRAADEGQGVSEGAQTSRSGARQESQDGGSAREPPTGLYVPQSGPKRGFRRAARPSISLLLLLSSLPWTLQPLTQNTGIPQGWPRLSSSHSARQHQQ